MMQSRELLKLYKSQKYQELRPLNTDGSVMLVREASSGTLLVRRTLSKDQKKVMDSLKDVNSVHIPEIISISKISEDCFYAYERYIEGRTLHAVLMEAGRLDELTAVNYMLQLCDTLSLIHQRGIIHRDIKPENILLTDEGVLYLLDFDISRISHTEKSRDTVIMGTEGYAAPEQFGFRQTDQRADIFSCGVLLNTMLTGMLPGKARDTGILLPKPYEEIIDRCIHLEPALRYENILELQAALGNAISSRALRHTEMQNLVSFHDEEPLKNSKNTKRNVSQLLSTVPGFRSGVLWKKLVMSVFYGAVLLMFIFCLIISPSGKDHPSPSYITASALMMLTVEIFCAGLYVLCFDIFHIQSFISLIHNRKNRLSRAAGIAGAAIIWTLLCFSALMLFAFVYGES